MKDKKRFRDLIPGDTVYTVRTYTLESHIPPKLLELKVIKSSYPILNLQWVGKTYGPDIRIDYNRDTDFEYRDPSINIFSNIDSANKYFLKENQKFLDNLLTDVGNLEKKLLYLLNISLDISYIIESLKNGK